MNLTKEEMQHMVDTMTPAQIKGWVQDQALAEWRKANCRGTVEAATGVGKTRIAVLAVLAEFEKNPDAVVYVAVPTETLRDNDWPDEFKTWGAAHLVDKTNFVCHASMDKIATDKEIDLLVFDEVHNMTPLNTLVFQRTTVYKVLGLTATIPSGDYPTDVEKRELIQALCPSVFKVTLEQAIDLKLVADFEVVVLKFDLDDTDFYVTGGSKAKPFKTTEVRQYNYLTRMLQRATFGNKPELKFVWIQKRMAFLYGLREKERLAREVMDKVMDGKRTLLFCGSIAQSHSLCGDNVYHSKVSDEKLTLFQEQKIPYLGVVQALNEGKNVEALDQILVIQLNSKELDIIQRIGRTIRFREGHFARVIVLVARKTVDEKWYESAFKNFDKKRITEHHVKTTTARAGQPAAK